MTLARRRKPFAVWLMLMDGTAWQFCVEKTLADALSTARALCWHEPELFQRHRSWIAHVDLPAVRRHV